jgi:hypothetical protein
VVQEAGAPFITALGLSGPTTITQLNGEPALLTDVGFVPSGSWRPLFLCGNLMLPTLHPKGFLPKAADSATFAVTPFGRMIPAPSWNPYIRADLSIAGVPRPAP